MTMLHAPILTHGMRLDKFLWAARFFKSRTLAAGLLKEGRVRVNRRLVDKAHVTVRIGDVLTFPQADRIRVVRVVALDEKRGPAPVAQTLYEDLANEQ
ncbi:RNA-binding S4 domain-containing protein [Elstera cyanobacteriorum]|uniref:RNA-binding S4 domain-containing protein n=1 Tax=Elstera cyanobacteriorum TaxID=2022747 RepID=UPI002357AA88|nr:RNA-binding S4 domain-containing protein [Elstera cyanobacteriorum]MCK6443864.1 RNA-binding S4 domain-containing protein [Elstera cyanobacteriorum]